MTNCSPARHVASALWCIIWLLLTAGCETPVGVERLDASTAQRQLTANVLSTDDLSPQARNVLRRWVKLGDWTGKANSWSLPLQELSGDGIDSAAVLVQGGTVEKPRALLGAALAELK